MIHTGSRIYGRFSSNRSKIQNSFRDRNFVELDYQPTNGIPYF